MSKPYRIHVDHDGWRWIGTLDQPTGFVALPHRSMHAAHRIVEELNGLLNAHDTQKDRAEKAEARVAELEREVAAWSPARHYGPEDDVYDDPKPEPSVAELQQRIATAKVGYYAPCAWCWSTVFAPNGEQVTCHKCGRKTPVPAPEGTETGQKSPPPSPVGAPRSDQGAGIKSDTQSPGPGRSDPRAPESSNLDTLAFGKSVPVPPARPCEGCKGVTDSPEAPLCPACRLWWLKQGFAEVEEPRPVVSCSDARCQCYQCVKDRADEEEDFAQLAKEQAKRATTRVEASPAAAAEVEARTGAYGRGLTKDEDAAYEAVLHGFMRDAMKGLDESMIGAIHEDAPCEIATLRMLPRAGLPSRDEVAAFLDGLVPRNEPKAEPERPCVRCRKGLPPDRAWFHAECMNPRANP